MFGCLLEMHCSINWSAWTLLHVLFQDYSVNFSEVCSIIILKLFIKMQCSSNPTRHYTVPLIGGKHDSKIK